MIKTMLNKIFNYKRYLNIEKFLINKFSNL